MWSTTMVAKCHESKHSALFILLYGLFIANTAHASFNDNRYNQLGKIYPGLLFSLFFTPIDKQTSIFSIFSVKENLTFFYFSPK